MPDTAGTGLKLGQKVPDFEFKTYEPTRGEFGTFRLRDQLAKERWTVLFFYPADFTFV
jgi:peroxiredoxin (alkyl hydroperoxide reductase subunit C)